LFSGYKRKVTREKKEEKKNGEENWKRTGKRTRQRRANFLPLFLLKETEAFVPHDREARTREERPFSGFIEAREGHRKRERRTGGGREEQTLQEEENRGGETKKNEPGEPRERRLERQKQ
jgi:hypothetical protein